MLFQIFILEAMGLEFLIRLFRVVFFNLLIFCGLQIHSPINPDCKSGLAALKVAELFQICNLEAMGLGFLIRLFIVVFFNLLFLSGL